MQRQKRSKQYTDWKRGAKTPKLTVGDNVRMHKPLSLQQQTGPNTFILSAGRRWYSAHLSLCPERLEASSQVETPEKASAPAETAVGLNKATR